MKKYRLFRSVSSLVVAFSLALSVAAVHADHGGGGGGGSDSLDLVVNATPTALAPAGSSVIVSLEAEDESGLTGGKLELEMRGLPASTYSVSVTLKSTGATVSLGNFASPVGEDEVEFGDEDGLPFPANFDPLDIATVSLLDASSAILFTADLTNPAATTSMDRNATVQVTPGPASPNAAGTVILSAHVIRGQTKGSLQLTIQGLVPNTQLIVAANGAMAKITKSDNRGNLSLNLGPKGKTGIIAQGVNLFDVHSVTAKTPSGNLLFNASL